MLVSQVLVVGCLKLKNKRVILVLQNLRGKLGKKKRKVLDHQVGMEQTRLIEFLDVLTTNEIISLLAQQRKVIDLKLSYLLS